MWESLLAVAGSHYSRSTHVKYGTSGRTCFIVRSQHRRIQELMLSLVNLKANQSPQF